MASEEHDMTVDDGVVEFARSHIGQETLEALGELTALTIRRYARAIEDGNPLYHDAEHARAHGHPDIVAPPNMLPSIVDWTEGGRQADLRQDGTEGESVLGIPHSGVRIMGGGEDMEFHAPAVAGDHILLRTRLEDVQERETRTGRMVVLRYRNTYETPDGRRLMTCMRSILLR
jgi:acyl dehydratase